MERTCKKCGETKPIEEFAKEKNRDRYLFKCKKCIETKVCVRCGETNLKEFTHTQLYYCKKCLVEKRHKKSIQKSIPHLQVNNFKVCGYCNEAKSIHDFSKKREYEKHTICKDCRIIIDNILNKKHNDFLLKIDALNSKPRILTDYEKIQIENNFIGRISARTGLKSSLLRKHPELIENYRQQIKLKQLIKTKKNENTETS